MRKLELSDRIEFIETLFYSFSGDFRHVYYTSIDIGKIYIGIIIYTDRILNFFILVYLCKYLTTEVRDKK